MDQEPEYRLSEGGTQVWQLNGKFHRENGPAIIENDGTKWWYLNNLCHRIDGPAIIRPGGTQYWIQNDELHRVDGPAIIDPSGRIEYWAFGIKYNSLEELTIGTVIDQ